MSIRRTGNMLILGLCITLANSTTALLSWGGTLVEDRQMDVIPLDLEVQQQIRRVIEAFSPERRTTEAVARKTVEEFKGFKNKTSGDLLLQVLAAYGGKDERRQNPHAEMAKRLLISNLIQDMTASDIVGAVAPKFEQAADPRLEQNLRLALDMVLFGGGRFDPDFTALSGYISQNPKEPPRKLIAYMYGHDSRSAMLFLARVYGGDATTSELTVLLKGDSKASMQTLAVHPEWWVRLYVATMMKRDAILRTPDVVKRLQDDKDPLVRRTVADFPGGLEAISTSVGVTTLKKTIRTFELNIPFKSDKADICVEMHPQLDDIAQLLKTNSQLTATIEGHTDQTRKSNLSYSKKLTGQRAQAVLDYFASTAGIDSNRMIAVGCGYSSLKYLNDPETGNSKNKRIEVHIQQK